MYKFDDVKKNKHILEIKYKKLKINNILMQCNMLITLKSKKIKCALIK